MRELSFTALAALLAVSSGACSRTVPVAVIGANGETMRGQATASLAGGTFVVNGRGGSCRGTFDAATRSETVSFAITCDDGRKGVARAVRDNAESGSGVVELSDGSKAKFVFGPNAAGF